MSKLILAALAIAVTIGTETSVSAADVKPMTISGATARLIGDRPKDLKVRASVVFASPAFQRQRLTVRSVVGDTLELQVIADPKSGIFTQVATPAVAEREFPDFRINHPGVTKVKITNGGASSVTVPITR